MIYDKQKGMKFVYQRVGIAQKKVTARAKPNAGGFENLQRFLTVWLGCVIELFS